MLHYCNVCGGEILANSKILEYKGHPIARKGNIIYLGNMNDKYVIMLQILETKKVDDLDVATKVSIQLQNNDPSINGKDRIEKESTKKGLYDAMDIATIWLERALANK